MTGQVPPVGVLYVANSVQIGGGNRVLTDIIRGIDRSRFAPCLVSPQDGPLVEWAATAGVPCSIVPDGDWSGRAGLYRRAARLVSLIVRRRTGIVHAIDPFCYRAAGLAGSVTRTPRVCHMGFPVGAAEVAWGFRHGPDVIVTCYEGQAREMVTHLGELGMSRQVLAIPNAVDLDRFDPDGDRHAHDSARWRRGAKHVVLIVGHLSEVKGHPTFLRAAAKVAAAVDGCRFLALGGETISPGFGVYLRQLADELGIGDRVDFLGWQPHVPEILRAADVVVLPSLVEGLPMAVLEAMACARPVVATAVNGTPEAVVHDSTGLLIQPSDPDELASAILKLIEQPGLAVRMGEAGRRRVEQHFSLHRSVATVQRLYDELLRNRNGHAVLRDVRA